MEYNGYTNYATWNVCLWLDNDYEMYNSKIRILKDWYHWEDSTELFAGDAESLAFELLGGTTPDLDDDLLGHRWIDVDWCQVANELSIELQELIEYEDR